MSFLKQSKFEYNFNLFELLFWIKFHRLLVLWPWARTSVASLPCPCAARPLWPPPLPAALRAPRVQALTSPPPRGCYTTPPPLFPPRRAKKCPSSPPFVVLFPRYCLTRQEHATPSAFTPLDLLSATGDWGAIVRAGFEAATATSVPLRWTTPARSFSSNLPASHPRLLRPLCVTAGHRGVLATIRSRRTVSHLPPP
jgi:hypothetical protein